MTTKAITPLRQRMIEDMNARKLCTGTQRGHIRALQAVRGVSTAIP
jgi:integrase/recombinase XerD